MIRRASVLGVGLVAALVLTAQPAAAQVGHVESADLGHRTTFRPNFEAGFGDDVTLLTVNLELVHWMPLKGSTWQAYAGGGVGTNIWMDEGATFMYGTLNVVFGVQHDKGLFAEMKVGIEPSVKLTVGYTLKIG
jgi:hypothetical protein